MTPQHHLPADIERTSLSIITAELETLGLTPPPETAAVVKRVIHTTADFDYAKNLRFTPGAVQSTESGETSVIIEKKLATSLSTMKNETPFVADKIQEQKKIIRNEFLTRIGILTANSSKRERVQTAEIEAGIGETVDLIYTVIDFWNKQIEQYRLPYKMEFNGTTEAYYAPTDETETEVNE